MSYKYDENSDVKSLDWNDLAQISYLGEQHYSEDKINRETLFKFFFVRSFGLHKEIEFLSADLINDITNKNCTLLTAQDEIETLKKLSNKYFHFRNVADSLGIIESNALYILVAREFARQKEQWSSEMKNEQTPAIDNHCDYCNPHGFRETLFRILDSYDYGEAFEWSTRCQNCENDCNEVIKKDCDQDCFECEYSNCEHCDYAPYQPQNSLNLTIAICGGNLMFEDKQDYRGKEGKQYKEINYCPMCGRKFNSEGNKNGI